MTKFTLCIYMYIYIYTHTIDCFHTKDISRPKSHQSSSIWFVRQSGCLILRGGNPGLIRNFALDLSWRFEFCILYPIFLFFFPCLLQRSPMTPSKLSPLQSVMIPTEGLHAKRIMIHTSKTLPFCMLRRTRLQRTDGVLQRFQCVVCTACRRARMTTFACKKVGRC